MNKKQRATRKARSKQLKLLPATSPKKARGRGRGQRKRKRYTPRERARGLKLEFLFPLSYVVFGRQQLGGGRKLEHLWLGL